MKKQVNIITEQEEQELVEMLHEAERCFMDCYKLGFAEEKLNYTRGCINAMERMLDKLGIEYDSVFSPAECI